MKAGVKIIDRYIGRELFTSMSLGLGFFTFVLLTKSMPKLIELVVSKGVTMGSVAMSMTAVSSIYGVPWAAQGFRELLFPLTRTRATIGIQERVFNDDFHGLILYTHRLDKPKG